jgi:DNA-binding LytR/AlgR family response regulator
MIVENKKSAQLLQRRLCVYPGFSLPGKDENGPDAIWQMIRTCPAVIFSDIQLPFPDGFQVMGLIERDRKSVIPSAYDFDALRAFERQAITSLIKPSTAERFDLLIHQLRGLLSKGFLDTHDTKNHETYATATVKHLLRNATFFYEIYLHLPGMLPFNFLSSPACTTAIS